MFKQKNRSQSFLAAFILVSLCSNTILQAIPAAPTEETQAPGSVYQTLRLAHMPSLVQEQLAEQRAQGELLKAAPANQSTLSATEIHRTEALSLFYEIFHAHAVAQKEQSPQQANQLDDTLINDLKIFCGDKIRPNSHLSGLIPTITTMGTIQKQRLLMEPTNDLAELTKRQAIIRELASNDALLASIERELEQVKKSEAALVWFWKRLAPEVMQLIDQVYWHADGQAATSNVNKNAALMQTLHSWRTHIAPVRCVTAPVESGVFIALYGKLIALFVEEGNPIVQLTGANQSFLQALIASSFMSYIQLYNHIQENGLTLDRWTVLYSLWAAYSTVFWGLNIYAQAIIAKTQNGLANDLQDRLIPASSYMESIKTIAGIINNNQTLSTLLPCAASLSSIDQASTAETQKLLSNLKTDTFKGESSFFSNRGRILASFKMMLSCKDHFVDSMKAIGDLDTFVALAKLYKAQAQSTNARYCFATYEQGDRPHIKATNYWMPMLNPETVVTNSIEIGGKKQPVVLITGANAGGKTTNINALLEATILALTTGMAPADEFVVSNNIRVIRSYMNIADATGYASLYQAEMRRIKALLEDVNELNDGEFALVAMDEVFTGTNHDDAVAGATLVVQEFAEMKNCLCLFATHFHELTGQEKEYPEAVTNFRVQAEKLADGSITFPYKIQPGISTQKIGVDLLAQENVFGTRSSRGKGKKATA